MTPGTRGSAGAVDGGGRGGRACPPRPTRPGISGLDAGCGSGYFTRRFSAAGCAVVGLDVDPTMLDFARARDPHTHYVRGNLLALPFADKSFVVAAAVASLCFVPDETRASPSASGWRGARLGRLLERPPWLAARFGAFLVIKLALCQDETSTAKIPGHPKNSSRNL